MAFVGVAILNIIFTILLCAVCILLIAGIILLITGFKLSKSGKTKGARICKIIGTVCLCITVAFNLYFGRGTIFPEKVRLQTPDKAVSVRKSDCTTLRRELEYENIKSLKQLIKDNPDLLYYIYPDNDKDESKGQTLIGYAISKHLDRSTKALLELGAEPDKISTEDTDDGAISLFIKNCDTYRTDWSIEMICTFLEYGADINKTSGSTPPIQFIISLLCDNLETFDEESISVLQKCKNAGADLMAENEYGQNAAEYFVQKEKPLAQTKPDIYNTALELLNMQ